MTITAAAPSLIPDALPAVTEPALSKAGRRPASTSAVVLALMNSSLLNSTGSPLRCGMLTPTISSLNLPAACAAAAFAWLPAARASCISRVMPWALATFSAVMPMWYWLYTSHRPSTIMVSVIFQSPMRWPSRLPLSTCGLALMFSWPPAITISLSPQATAWAASITAFRPEPQTALMVSAGVSLATPAFIMA
ncbi:hypothetical protein Y695_02233 [Hydrogenophaga sp. T4]|nr:hypothetical protein Y695_02233 [Hydrogenophaga sp. T4]